VLQRNLEAEAAAMLAGLAPGQVRLGLRLLEPSITVFEGFVAQIGRELYFVGPLLYHNAVLFERCGFAYQRGRRLMEGIHRGVSVRRWAGGSARRINSIPPYRSLGLDPWPELGHPR
jgi:hypothetical protein